MTRPKEERPEKQVAVWLRSDLKDALTAKAEETGKSQKAILEEAIAAYLVKQPLQTTAPR